MDDWKQRIIQASNNFPVAGTMQATWKNTTDAFAELYFKSRTTAMPEPYVGDDLATEIYELFYDVLRPIRDMVAPHARIIIQTKYANECFLLIIDEFKPKILWSDNIKACNFTWKNEEDLDDWCESVAKTLKLTTGEKGYACGFCSNWISHDGQLQRPTRSSCSECILPDILKALRNHP